MDYLITIFCCHIFHPLGKDSSKENSTKLLYYIMKPGTRGVHGKSKIVSWLCFALVDVTLRVGEIAFTLSFISVFSVITARSEHFFDHCFPLQEIFSLIPEKFFMSLFELPSWSTGRRYSLHERRPRSCCGAGPTPWCQGRVRATRTRATSNKKFEFAGLRMIRCCNRIWQLTENEIDKSWFVGGI